MSLKLPADFAKKISESLGMTPLGVDEVFTIEEDKQGFFVAKLKPKQFLETSMFRTMCALARDLGGEGYLQGAKAWAVPGPCAKKSPEKPAKPAKKEPTGVTPPSVAMDKSRPPVVSVPVAALLSMAFRSRIQIEGSDFAELVESVKAYGVLEPILVRPKASGLYEVVAGDRRLAAAKEAGLDEVPVTIRFLSDEEAFVLHLTENLQRKDLSEEEKSRALGELAKRTKWNAHQIADKLKMSYRWVCLYLPEEYKDRDMAELGKLGAESRADAQKEQDLHVAASLAANTASEEARKVVPPIAKTVNCERCGDPIEGVAIHSKGKFYCVDCAEILKTEQPEPEGVPEPEPVEGEGRARESVSEPAKPKHKPEALLTGYPWTCPECGDKYIINHVDWPGSDHREHRLEACKK